MSAKHHITSASTVYQGDAYYVPLFNSTERRGAPITFLTRIDLGTPDALDADGVATTEDMSAKTTYPIDGALASGGVATLDVPRAVSIVASNAGDTTQTCTITGTDAYGEALVETITYNGTTTVNGKKAFKTVTSAENSANLTANGTVGTSDVLGLPYRIANKVDVIHATFDDVIETTHPTVVAGVDSTATATTGDVRGTVDLNSAANNKQTYVLAILDSSTKASLVGVDQYGG